MKLFGVLLGCVVAFTGVVYMIHGELPHLPWQAMAKDIEAESPTGNPDAQKNTVIVFGTPECSYCRLAKELLKEKGIPFIEKDVTEEDALEEMKKCAPASKTIPQIMIGKVHIGGYGELKELERDGKLEKMVAGEI